MSHRSSLQTILFANQFLESVPGGLKAQYVGFTGKKPKLYLSPDRHKLTEVFYKTLKEISTTHKSICIIHRDKQDADKTIHRMNSHHLPTYYAEKDSWDFSKKLHVSTYLQIKGLEFDFVVLLGSNDFYSTSRNPNKNQILYTVCTRTKEQLLIFEEKIGLYGHFLPDSFDSVL